MTARFMACWLVTLAAWGVACQSPDAEPATEPSPAAAAAADDRARMPLARIMPVPALPAAAQPDAKTQPAPRAEHFLRRGAQRFAQRLWSEAIAELARAQQAAPALIEARGLLARAHLQQGDAATATEIARAILQDDPRNVAAYRLLGEVAYLEARDDDALRQFRLALMAGDAEAPTTDRLLAHLGLALVLERQGYLAAAAEQWSAWLAGAAAVEPAAADVEFVESLQLYQCKGLQALARLRTRLGEHVAAAEALRRAVAACPDDAALQRNLATALARAGQADEALAIARALLAGADEGAQALAWLESLCEAVKRPDCFEAEIVRLAEASPDAALRGQLVAALRQRGRTSEALAVLTAAAADSLSVDERFLLAELYLDDGQFVEAIGVLHAAVQAQPAGSSRAAEIIADANEDVRREMSPLLRERAAQPDADAVVHGLLGAALAASGEQGDAIAAYREAVTLNDDLAGAHAALAALLVEARQWEDALAAANRAISAGVNLSSVYLDRGQAQAALDRPDAAEESYLEAARRDRTSPVAYFELARLLEQRNELRRATQLYRRILDEIEPRFVPARERLIRLYLADQPPKLNRARAYFSDFARFDLTGPAVERSRARITRAERMDRVGRPNNKPFRITLRKIIERYPDDVETYGLLAASHADDGEYEAALGVLDEALAVDPADLTSRKLRAALLERLLRFDEAYAAYRGLLEDRPNSLELQFKVREFASYHEDYDVAVEMLRTLIARETPEELDRVRPAFVEELVRTLLRAERPDEAVAESLRWLELAPDDQNRRRQYLATLRRADQEDEAVATAERWLAADPMNRGLRLQYAGELQNAKRYAEAQQLLLEWLGEDADDILLHRQLMLVCWAAEAWDTAIELAKTGMEMPDHRPAYADWLGRTFVFADRLDEAVAFFREQIEYFRGALRQAIAARDRDAANEYQGLLESAENSLISVLIEAKRYNEAESMIHRLLEPLIAAYEGGETSTVFRIRLLRSRLTYLYQLTDRELQAIQQLEAIYRIMPQDPGVNNDLGYTWADRGENLEKAEQMIRFAVARDPGSAAYLDSLGWVLYKRGRIEEAVHYLREAVRLSDPPDPVLHDHYGDALYRLGRIVEARQQWARGIEAAEQSEEAPLTGEDQRVRSRLRDKLERLDADEPVEVADIVDTPDASPGEDERPKQPDAPPITNDAHLE